MALDHDAIRRDEDRAWTSALIEALDDPDQRTEAAGTLGLLSDPRAEAPLTALMTDLARPEATRAAAGEALLCSTAPDDRLLRLGWWQRGDAVLARHALLRMDRGDAEIVAAVAADPEHRHHADAITSMAHGFADPRFQALKVAALRHRDPAVRRAACDALFWDEPSCAEADLLVVADDDHEAVATAALETLEYYPSRRVLTAVVGLRERVTGARREAVQRCVDALQATIVHALDSQRAPVVAALRRWLAPIAALLDDDVLVAEPPPGDAAADPVAVAALGSPPPRLVVSAAEIIDCYAELGGSWSHRKAGFRTVAWDAIAAADRAGLVAFLVSHADPWVRGAAAAVLAGWDAQDALVGLLADPCHVVRKSAMYWLGQTRPSPVIAARAWGHLQRPEVGGTSASETVETYAAHAGDAARPQLISLAADDHREDVRTRAIHALAQRRDSAALRDLAALLVRPPAVTWAVHTALLWGLADLGLTAPGAASLGDVDDLHVQVALARLP